MRLSVGTLRQVVKRDLPIAFVPQQLTSYGGLELLLLGFQRRRARRHGIRDGRSGSVTVIQRFGYRRSYCDLLHR